MNALEGALKLKSVHRAIVFGADAELSPRRSHKLPGGPFN
jgi:hypothetical protein